MYCREIETFPTPYDELKKQQRGFFDLGLFIHAKNIDF
jgi:hypothetical protein